VSTISHALQDFAADPLFLPGGNTDISVVRIAQQSGKNFLLGNTQEKGESLETFALASLEAKIFATCRPWGISKLCCDKGVQGT